MKVVFLDRDGVINKEVKYLHKISDFELTHKCLLGLRNILNRGFEIIIVTNQAGIAKGLFRDRDYKTLTKYYLDFFESQGIHILDVFYCPHHPEGAVKRLSIKCNCRKPLPGMLLEAAKKYKIDLKSSIIVGDKLSDILAGKAAGVANKVLVKSGHNLTNQCIGQADNISEDLYTLSISSFFHNI